jgi:chromosome partitioning protein
MKIVSVINYKGGVGKTTLTANLGAELAYRDTKVLLIDLDPQSSLTFSFIPPDTWHTKYASSKTIKNWFESISESDPVALKDLIFTPKATKDVLNGSGKLDLIASHLGLINVDLELATELGGASLKQAQKKFLKVHSHLLKGLDSIEGYDIILIDCPPNFNIVTKNAIVASDKILIPAKPDYLSTLGIDYLIRSLKTLIGDYNEYAKIGSDEHEEINPEILGVVFTMIQIHNGQPISALRPFINQTKRLGIPVFDNYFRENKTIFADAPQYGVPVVLNRYSGNTYKSVVAEIEELVSEFATEIGL